MSIKVIDISAKRNREKVTALGSIRFATIDPRINDTDTNKEKVSIEMCPINTDFDGSFILYKQSYIK